jgi:hypothetical protein
MHLNAYLLHISSHFSAISFPSSRGEGPPQYPQETVAIRLSFRHEADQEPAISRDAGHCRNSGRPPSLSNAYISYALLCQGWVCKDHCHVCWPCLIGLWLLRGHVLDFNGSSRRGSLFSSISRVFDHRLGLFVS